MVARFQPAADPRAEPGTSSAPLPYEGVYFRELLDSRRSAAREEPCGAAPARTSRPARLGRARRTRPRSRAGCRRTAKRPTGSSRAHSRAEPRSSRWSSRQRKLPAPPLYDLTELQRHANRLFGYSARKTLDIAQSLYESKKLLSYPRTDSRHLSASVAAELGEIVAAIAVGYAGLVAPGTGERPLGRRYVDDSRVSDHHAIIPTATRAEGLSLTQAEARIYDLVCRRLLAAWHPDHLYSTTTVITAIHSPGREHPPPR